MRGFRYACSFFRKVVSSSKHFLTMALSIIPVFFHANSPAFLRTLPKGDLVVPVDQLPENLKESMGRYPVGVRFADERDYP